MSNETSGQKKINLTENCEAVKTFLEIAERDSKRLFFQHNTKS